MADEILSNREQTEATGEVLNPADFNILVVDDVPANVMLLRMLLVREKFNVLTCNESPKVHDICLSQQVDLILQDVMMPVMTGYDVCRQLKADPKTADIPVIFLTAYFDKEHTLEGFRAGGIDYVSKPFEKEILLARVTSQLKLVSVRRMIQQKNENLSNTLSTRDRLYSVIAHDLRSPLGVIQISLKAMEDILSPDMIGPEMHEMIVDSNKQVTELFNLLDNLLKWTKSQTGALNVVYQDFQASELVDTIMDMYSNVAGQKGIALRTGQIDSSLSVHSDIDMCKTILRNLVSNAIKFTESGKKITLDIINDGKYAQICVKDEGSGMTPEELSTLFDKEKHISKYGTAREEGSGLGLMLVKDFVDRLGGQITVQSQPGVGSIFCFMLPLN